MCRCALYTHCYTQSLVPHAEFIGFFIGFSTATTQISTHFPNSCSGREEEGIKHGWGREPTAQCLVLAALTLCRSLTRTK